MIFDDNVNSFFSNSDMIGSWPAVWQARVRISARHPREDFPSEQQAPNEEMERGLSEWRWMMYCMNVIVNVLETGKDKINKKNCSSHQTNGKSK
jgi:hypothetical protein